MTTLLVKSVPVEQLYSPLHRTANDVALAVNLLEPKLGDRVVNLSANGVPFGLKGTVVTIHPTTHYVEVCLFGCGYAGADVFFCISLFSSILRNIFA